jgi:lambda repressor-like predicted transcriptional regulator
VGELYDCVCQKLKEAGQPIPEDGWQKMQDLLVDALGVHDDEVKPSAFLMKDLGAN